MEFSKNLANVVWKALASEEINKAIEEAIIQTVKRSISNHLRSYSDFGKTIDSAVAEALKFKPIDLPSYNDLIVKLVRNAVKSHMESAIAQQVEKQVNDLFEPAPETLKLSELIEKFVSRIRENNEDGCVCYGESEAKVVVENSGQSFVHVKLYESSDDKREDIFVGLHVGFEEPECNSGHIYHLHFADTDVENKMFVDNLHGLERMLFQMKAAKSKIILDCDPDDCDLDTSPRHD